MKPNTFDATHPSRRRAIRILEGLAEIINMPKVFDLKWYDCEDFITGHIEDLIELEVKIRIKKGGEKGWEKSQRW